MDRMADLVAPLYDAFGMARGAVRLDLDIFGIEPNRAVMHQVVVAHLAASRSGSAKTKTRAEVRGGGRKPWRQKHTGRARHGSIRSPLWVGGGVIHGPQPRDYTQRTPRKMRALALRGALSARAREEAIKVVNDFDWEFPKTKRAHGLLKDISASGKALVVLDRSEVNAARSFRNLPGVMVAQPGHLNTYEVLRSDTVVFSLPALEEVTGAPSESLPGPYDISPSDFLKVDEPGDEARLVGGPV